VAILQISPLATKLAVSEHRTLLVPFGLKIDERLKPSLALDTMRSDLGFTPHAQTGTKWQNLGRE
jgi:hypothetical protein